MRSLGLALLLIASLASPARSGEEASTAHALAELGAVVGDPTSTWNQRYAAYDAAKGAMAAETDPERRAADEAAYDALRPRVAEALRRDAVPAGGWALGIFATLLLWGGFAFCLRKAMAKTPEVELDEDETWPIRPEGQ